MASQRYHIYEQTPGHFSLLPTNLNVKKKLILKVYKKSVAFGWGKKDQRPIVLLQGIIFNALTDVINLLPFNEFQYVLP